MLTYTNYLLVHFQVQTNTMNLRRQAKHFTAAASHTMTRRSTDPGSSSPPSSSKSTNRVQQQTRERVAAIRARRPKCPEGRKCNDQSCTMHPARGLVRRKASNGYKQRGVKQRRQSKRDPAHQQQELLVRVSTLTNETRRLKHRLDKAEQSPDANGLAKSLLECMTPTSKSKTLRRLASTPGLTPVKKKLRLEGYQVRSDRLFVDDEVEAPEIAEKFVKFMMDNDNSFECPDKKEGVRYRWDTVEVLHEKFMAETMVDCSVRTFGRYIPSNIVKPKPQDWGTSLCKTCLNPELKVECLREPGVNLEWLLGLDKEQLQEFSEKHSTNELITYKEWQSERVTKTKTAKVADRQEILIDTKTYRNVQAVCTEKKKEFVKKLLEDLQSLKEHQARKISQFRRIKYGTSLMILPTK